MRSDIQRIILAVCAAVTAACASTPHTAESVVATTAQPKLAPQTLAVATHTPATAPAPARNSEIDLSLVKAGYSVQRRHDQLYYCRNEIITGNRIGTWVCLTSAQIQNEKQDLAQTKDIMNKPNNRCLGPECK